MRKLLILAFLFPVLTSLSQSQYTTWFTVLSDSTPFVRALPANTVVHLLDSARFYRLTAPRNAYSYMAQVFASGQYEEVPEGATSFVVDTLYITDSIYDLRISGDTLYVNDTAFGYDNEVNLWVDSANVLFPRIRDTIRLNILKSSGSVYSQCFYGSDDSPMDLSPVNGGSLRLCYDGTEGKPVRYYGGLGTTTKVLFLPSAKVSIKTDVDTTYQLTVNGTIKTKGIYSWSNSSDPSFTIDSATGRMRVFDTVSGWGQEIFGMDCYMIYRSLLGINDGGSWTFFSDKIGWGHIMVNSGATYASFRFEEDGTVTLLSDCTADVSNTDTPGKLCIFDSGDAITIKNNLGVGWYMLVEIHYMNPPL